LDTAQEGVRSPGGGRGELKVLHRLGKLCATLISCDLQLPSLQNPEHRGTPCLKEPVNPGRELRLGNFLLFLCQDFLLRYDMIIRKIKLLKPVNYFVGTVINIQIQSEIHHPQDGGSMALRNTDTHHNKIRSHNAEDLDMDLTSW